MSWSLTGLALVSCLSVPPRSQDPSAEGARAVPTWRRLTIGRAVLPDGKGWAGAEVFFYHRPLPERCDVGKPDLVRVQSSSKGRFRVELLERRPYMVWARGKDEKGRLWVSQPHPLVLAGQPIKLQRSKTVAFSEHLNLRRWDKAKEQAVGYQLRFGPMHQTLPVPAGEQKDSLVLPPTPYDHAWLEALGVEGRVLREFRVTRRSLPIFPLVWGYQAPDPLRIRVSKADKSRVKGATVSVQMHYESAEQPAGHTPAERLESLMPRTPFSRWAPIGQTDAKGDCALELPKESIDNNQVYLRITAPGMCEKFVRLWPYKDRRKEGPAKKGGFVDVQLDPAPRIHGRILWHGQEPAAGFPLLVLRKGRFMEGKREHWVLPAGELIRTQEDGSFSVTFVGPKTWYRIVTPMDVDMWKRLAASYEDLPLPAGELLLHEAPPESNRTVDLGDIRLDRLIAVDAHVPHSRERGAQPSLMLLKDRRDRVSSSSEAPHVLARRFGPRGRSIFLMPTGDLDTLVLHSTEGSSQESLKLVAAQAGKVHRWEVVLDPYASIPVKVRTSDGKPLARVGLETMGGGYTHLSKLCSEIYEFNTISIQNTTTDEKGDATLRLIKVAEQTYDIMIDWNVAHRMKASVSPVRISSNAWPESITIEVEK